MWRWTGSRKRLLRRNNLYWHMILSENRFPLFGIMRAIFHRLFTGATKTPRLTTGFAPIAANDCRFPAPLWNNWTSNLLQVHDAQEHP